jgi:hypothetical protein
VSSTTASASAPPASNTTVGDLWWDMGNSQLKVWSGSAWVVIGPAYTSAQGKTGIEASVVTETGNGNSHILLKFWVNNVLTAVLSRDPSYTTSSLTGFGPTDPVTVNPGFNLSTGGATPLAYYGDANAALNLKIPSGADAGTYPAADFLRASQATPIFNSALTINNDNGLDVGLNRDFSIKIDSSSVKLMSNISGKDMVLYNKVNDVFQDLVRLNGHTGEVTVKNDPTASSSPRAIATKNYVDTTMGITGPALMRNGSNTITGNIAPATNGVYDFGSASSKFNTIYATTFQGVASEAYYADLAERFESDRSYAPGTVVELGGIAEITSVVDDLSDNVFGVVSTNAAYLMNAGAGSNATHPPVAMQGQVPVRVIGTVKKGDRLVSAGNGLARAASKSEITSFNVIGRALQSKTTLEEGVVKAAVRFNS